MKIKIYLSIKIKAKFINFYNNKKDRVKFINSYNNKKNKVKFINFYNSKKNKIKFNNINFLGKKNRIKFINFFNNINLFKAFLNQKVKYISIITINILFKKEVRVINTNLTSIKLILL